MRISKIRLLLGTVIVLSVVLLASASTYAKPFEGLWFNESGADIKDALPLGNGRQGAMVCGGVEQERIILNEISLWSGSKQDADLDTAYEHLDDIRKLLLQGQNGKAGELVNKYFICRPPGTGDGASPDYQFGCFQGLGEIRLAFGAGEFENYRRQLDFTTAVATVKYKQNGVNFKRETFVTAPGQAVVMRLTADKPGQISFTAELDRSERRQMSTFSNDTILMKGQLNNGVDGKGMKYSAMARAVNEGGSLSSDSGKLTVKGADAVTLFITASTDYAGPSDKRGPEPVAKSLWYMNKVATARYEQLLKEHIADHQQYYNRFQLRMGSEKQVLEESKKPTNVRLAEMQKTGVDKGLVALYCQYGRYLLISSSRPGELPANLQGLWSDTVNTAWNGDYHFNINVQMNYWPAEVTNLHEMHEPLLKLIESLQEPGRKTAQTYYRAPGWIAHVITNVWGFTSPGDDGLWGSTVSGSAW